MATGPRWGKLSAIANNPDLARVVIEHAHRGIRIQLFLRGVLVAFLVATIALAPPAHDRVLSDTIAGIYTCWYLALLFLIRGTGIWALRYLWFVLYIDVLAIATLTLVAGNSAVQSWTADILIDGFFLLPVMAATQLRPWVCISVCLPTAAVYVLSSIATRSANGEPWGSLWLRTVVFVGLATGCVLLSRLQQARVLTIGALVSDRNALLAEIVGIEERERRELAEHLHDGALQYVLAGRQDLADARARGDAESFERLDRALTETSQLLRATVTDLHPAVLERAGLRRAVEELAGGYAARGAFTIEWDADRWPDGVRTTADSLLYASARELLSNVAKHAEASRVRITLEIAGTTLALILADDGVGLSEEVLGERLAAGHIGLASRRTRVEAAGGTMRISSAQPHGTRVAITLPGGLITTQ